MKRREFIKISGAAALAAACAPRDARSRSGMTANAQGAGHMEYRKNPLNGDEVSLLGFGCMRWPMIKNEKGNDVIDQEAVNEMVDYAIEHGVNYFDTSPVYLQGQSEAATAKALLRHPRDSYYIATKMSNFSNAGKEASLRMYHRSFEIFQTDHMDYYLLHSVSGEADFKRRFFDNGILDFLIE